VALNCSRDERGWRVPREGTTSRQVYELTLQGHSIKQIVAITGKPYSTVRSMREQFMSAAVVQQRQSKSEGFMRLAEASRRYQQVRR
jgi:transposase